MAAEFSSLRDLVQHTCFRGIAKPALFTHLCFCVLSVSLLCQIALSVAFSPQESAPKIFRGSVKTHFLLFADAENATSKAVSGHTN